MPDVIDHLNVSLAGRYTIERELGQGGMATVYLAHDVRHNRPVALKVLRPELAAAIGAKRFLREIETVARLAHPHILPLYDSGRTGRGADGPLDEPGKPTAQPSNRSTADFLYYVMPYVEGESLRDRLARETRLPVDDAIQIAREVADALDHAHRHGVIHRDIKPENILLQAGHAVVADFGIALPVGTRTTALTGAGVSVGTPLYMSPEQATGEQPVGAPSDIYALGCVMFETLAGRPPFLGPSVEQLFWQHVSEDPPPLETLRPDVPADIAAIVTRALRKDPGDRYASGGDLVAALRGGETGTSAFRSRRGSRPFILLVATTAVIAAIGLWRLLGDGAGGGPRIEALAVLPLEDLTPGADQDYFADGMTEALITNLAQIRALKVISRTSVMRYKGPTASLPEIARALAVDAVVEGTVLRAGDRIRITAQLIDAMTDQHLWAGTYERTVADVLALQMDVARAVAEEIRVVVSPEERLRLGASREVSFPAYEAYLRGRFEWNRRTPDGFREAIRHFQRAIEADPTYALPYSGLADCYILLVEWRQIPARDGVPLARAAAERALALDSSLAEAHTSLAETEVIAWNWEVARREFRRALALNPGYATAHQWYGFFLSKMGRHDEAIAELTRALERDPLSLIIRTEFGRVYYHARRYDDAERVARSALDLDSSFADAHWVLASVAAEQPGEAEAAIAGFRRASSVLPSPFELAYAQVKAGNQRAARQILDSILARYARGDPNPRHAQVAEIYAALGLTDSAFAALERAYEAGIDDQLTYLKVRPPLDPLRDDPRFADLLRRMRFP